MVHLEMWTFADEILPGRLKCAGEFARQVEKPSPNFLGVDKVLDEESLRKHIRGSLMAARVCKMVITQRDVYTIHHQIDKAKRYVDIIREEIENHWK